MTQAGRIVLSSDHAALELRRAIAAHLQAKGWIVSDIGPTTSASTHYPEHGGLRPGWSPRANAGSASCCAARGKGS
jgi:hypothetical protein